MRANKQVKAQAIVEYAIVFGLIIAAVVLMGPYVGRAWNARVKGAADALALQNSGQVLTQYAPYYSKSGFDTDGTQKQTEAYDKGKTTLTATNTQTTKTGGFQETQVDMTQDDDWK